MHLLKINYPSISIGTDSSVSTTYKRSRMNLCPFDWDLKVPRRCAVHFSPTSFNLIIISSVGQYYFARRGSVQRRENKE